MTDEELMSNYQTGDLQAFEELYKRYKGKVSGFLYQRVNEPYREDVFQKVFTRLHHKKHLYKADYPFSPWFFTLIRNVVIDFYREKKEEHAEFDEMIHQEMDSDDSQFDLSILSGLDEKDALLLYQKFVEGQSYEELENELNIKSATLRKRVSRIVKKLKLNFGYN
ncbi:MAG: sigma-70 family RNA polymerase sigma factor [Bacteriovoracaceae bacterium]|nr:sigma-70 family RNA polymerase sigma factor [Bacteriovoracaceae bacterium]